MRRVADSRDQLGLYGQEIDRPDVVIRREDSLPSNVWLVQQERSREQRAGRYVEAAYHTQKNPPELARRMVEHLKAPQGAVIADCFAGTGTMVCEALEMGYRTMAAEIEEEQIKLNLRVNVALAADRRRTRGLDVPEYSIHHADARQLPWADCSVDHFVTSPPYANSDPSRDSSGRSLADRYHNWATRLHRTGSHAGQAAMSDGSLGSMRWREFVLSLRQCAGEIRRVLKPGGFAAIAVKEFWDKGMVDLPGAVIRECRRAGLTPTDRIFAIEAAMNEYGMLISRASAHRHLLANKQNEDGRSCPRGVPHVTSVLIFRKGE